MFELFLDITVAALTAVLVYTYLVHRDLRRRTAPRTIEETPLAETPLWEYTALFQGFTIFPADTDPEQPLQTCALTHTCGWDWNSLGTYELHMNDAVLHAYEHARTCKDTQGALLGR